MNERLRQHAPIYRGVREASAPFNSMDAADGFLSGSFDPADWTYFSNPMRWPGYGPGYWLERSEVGFDTEGFSFARNWEPPRERAAVAPFTIFTLEVDADGEEAFQDQLDLLWTADDSGSTPVGLFDKNLRGSFRDYRGYCAVSSGNKSVHFHFLFDTSWLNKTVLDEWAGLNGVDPKNSLRNHVDGEMRDDLFYEYYRLKWRALAQRFNEVAGRDLTFDPALGQFSQKRRLPWGMREIGRDGPESNLHGFTTGTRVPQVVLEERILEASPKGATGYFMRAKEGNQGAEPSAPRVRKRGLRPRTEQATSDLLDALRLYLAEEWGVDHPRPASITEDGGVYFYNHPEDRHPSTYVGPGHWRLAHRGRHSIQTAELPGRLDIGAILEILTETLRDRDPGGFEATGFQPQVSSKGQKLGIADRVFHRFLARAKPGAEWLAMSVAADQMLKTFPHACITSVEGIGKSRGVLAEATRYRAEDALENFFAGSSLTSPQKGLHVFASPSYDQAAEQMASYLKAGAREGGSDVDDLASRRAILLKTFAELYREVAREKLPGGKDDVINYTNALGRKYPSLVHAVHDLQPDIYEEVTRRKNEAWKIEPVATRWNPEGGTDSGFHANFSTMVFTVHEVAQGLHVPTLSNAWLHPDFDFDLHAGSFDAYGDLAKELRAYRIIHDEISLSDLLWIATAEEVAFAEAVVADAPKHWSEMSGPERLEVYQRIQKPDEMSFYRLLNLIEAGFTAADAIAVNYDNTPYGNDNHPDCIYRGMDGKPYFISERKWIRDCRARVVFLTTEGLASVIVKNLRWTPPNRMNSGSTGTEPESGSPDDMESIIPTESKFRVFRWDREAFFQPDQIDLCLDKRANASHIDELVAELVSEDHGFDLVITNGSGHAKSISHMSSQGRNDLTEVNIASVITYLAPALYGILNALNAKYRIPDVISQYYRDMINQAIGRNRGFRRREVNEGDHVLIMSQRLYLELGAEFFRTGRYRFTMI